jgi:hypothetical protein
LGFDNKLAKFQLFFKVIAIIIEDSAIGLEISILGNSNTTDSL